MTLEFPGNWIIPAPYQALLNMQHQFAWRHSKEHIDCVQHLRAHRSLPPWFLFPCLLQCCGKSCQTLADKAPCPSSQAVADVNPDANQGQGLSTTTPHSQLELEADLGLERQHVIHFRDAHSRTTAGGPFLDHRECTESHMFSPYIL